MKRKVRVGDIVLFDWPTQSWGPGDPILGVSENLKLGLVVEVVTSRWREDGSNDLTLFHEGEKFIVPESWCRFPTGRGE